jgi:DNA-binding response OmpR family regulator
MRRLSARRSPRTTSWCWTGTCRGCTGTRFAGRWVDPARRIATRNGQRLALGRKELAVLEYLLAAQGRVVTAEELLERVWDEAADPFTTTVKVTIRRLRVKLGDPPVVETVPQGGYRI